MNPNQLENAEKHADAGKESTSQGNLKMAAEDYANSVEESLLEDANRRMSKAVDHVRASFRKKHNPTDVKEDAESDVRRLKQEADEGRVRVRNVRKKLMQEIGRLERDGQLSSDEQHRLADSVQQATDKHCEDIDEILGSKADDFRSP